VAALHWAQALLVPVALAVLLTFVLTPTVTWLQRRIGRVTAVLIVVIVVFTFLALAGYGVYRQMATLGETLPRYRTNILAKIVDIRGVKSNGSIEKLERALEQIKGDLGSPQPDPGTIARPLVVTTDRVAGLMSLGWLGPMVAPLGTACFVVVLVLFMLLEREELRDRLIALFGHKQLAVTTKAINEAATRVSRQLLLQTFVNLIYGTLAAVGLYMFGVPYPLFWGAAGVALRFIPYLGPIVAAAGPILLALAALPGWIRPLEVAAFYAALELFTNLVLETVWYAGAVGVSQVALLVAIAFWTWLWGPLGLLMATPLTVCVVVVGKHVSTLESLGRLLSDAPALTTVSSYYQRILAEDEAGAAEVIDAFSKTQSPDAVYDAILIPALNYAERDRLTGRLSPEEEAAVVKTTGEILDELAQIGAQSSSATEVRILGCAANGAADDLALRMLGQLVSGSPIALDISSTRLMVSELVERVRDEKYSYVCIADLPPSEPSRTRYLIKKLRAAVPDVRIAVGRWAPPDLADDTPQPILDAGASHVASTLLETRKYLIEAANVGAPPVPANLSPTAA
jgi:predicted PurR-regulated permease PerM